MARTILVVEDEPKLREVYRETLSDEGYGVLTADNGISALECVKSGQSIDLIITDIKMTGMHGIEFVRTIRQEGIETPVIMCSAYDQMKNDIEVITAGIADFLTKPIDIDELVVKVNSLLGGPA